MNRITMKDFEKAGVNEKNELIIRNVKSYCKQNEIESIIAKLKSI